MKPETPHSACNLIDKTFKAFDKDLVGVHVKDNLIGSEEYENIENPIGEMVESFFDYADQSDISPAELIGIVINSVITYILMEYEADHIAAKLLSVSLVFEKCAVEYAQDLVLTTASFTAKKAIDKLQKNLVTRLKGLGIDYKDVKGINSIPLSLVN